MSRLAWIVFALVIASCSRSAGNQDRGASGAPPPSTGQKIAVPGAGTPAAGNNPRAGGTGTAPDDPRFHLQPEEGTLTVDHAETTAGTEATVAIKIAPATGYHVATDYPIKLTLEPTDGVKLAKSELTAGGRDKVQGDAQALSEQGLAFAIKATPEKAGSFEIKGTLKFGVCDKESCHPKKQPIAIALAAK